MSPHINDPELSAFLLRVQLEARKLSELSAGRDEMKLFEAISNIQLASTKACERLNDLLYGRGYKPPVEMMGN